MSQTPVHILVVDDDEPGRYAKSRVLRGRGYEVSEAASGHAALESVAARPPDLVLLDVRLPDIDGLTVCREIKNALPQVTVLQTSSARVDSSARVAALEAGADTYLVEPIDPDELIAVVHAMLRMRAAEQEVRYLNEALEARARARAIELAEANRKLGVERTERQKTEEVLWHMQKLEAVGQLTGGLAHDFNNLLTVITGNVELVQEALSGSRKLSSERLGQLLRAVLSAADHGARMTHQLLAFARRSLLHVEVVDLNAIIHRSGDLLRRALGEAITLDFVPAEGLWSCVIDPVKFEAALLNLAVNARDAMPMGGRFAIWTENILIAAEDAAAPAEILPGRYIGVVVSDTGIGMEPAVLERIFEPFFTTKDVGQGSGLGLSQLYGFIKQSNGHVTVDSAPGGGTTFRLCLPFSTELPKAEMSTPRRGIGCSQGRERILIVEDNSDVRDVVVEMIRALGYSVLVAHDAQEALRLLRDDPPIDLLFTDIVMPNGMSGVALAKAARALDDGIKIVLTSGYPAGTGATVAMDHTMITKPYRRDELARVLRDTLDS